MFSMINYTLFKKKTSLICWIVIQIFEISEENLIMMIPKYLARIVTFFYEVAKCCHLLPTPSHDIFRTDVKNPITPAVYVHETPDIIEPKNCL